MEPNGEEESSLRKRLYDKIILIATVITLLIAILTFLHLEGWLQFPEIRATSHNSIELKKIDNKLVFRNFLSFENSRNGMGYVTKIDAQIVHKCDRAFVASFDTDSVVDKDGLRQFATIGLKHEEPTTEGTYIFYQSNNSILSLQPGEIYELTISYYTLNKLPYFFGETSKTTIVKIFSLSESQINNLFKASSNHRKNRQLITVPLCDS
jgi:hypothetical protein